MNSGGINFLELALNASLFVKVVMLVLVVFSFLSWVIIFRKMTILNRAMSGRCATAAATAARPSATSATTSKSGCSANNAARALRIRC